MNRRLFCKHTISALMIWGINPLTVFADSNNNVLSGEFFINGNLTSKSFENLENNTIETKKSKTIIKVQDDFYLIRPNTELQFKKNRLKNIIKGSVHAVFKKSKDELQIKMPQGTIGIRGTSIFIDTEPEKDRSYFCNCYGVTDLYGKDGKLVKSITSKGHVSGMFTDKGEFNRYGLSYISNKYARKHPEIFDIEMKKVGCKVINSHCSL